MITSKRIEKWDILKFILIFLVVLGHVTESSFDKSIWQKNLITIIYSFHMPVFIFVSGLFSKKTIKHKNYDKVFGYLFMFFAAKMIISIGRLIATGEMGFAVLSERGLPWYMLAIFAFQMITIAVQNFSPKYVLIFSILLSCFAGYDTLLGDELCLMRIIVFYPFFYLGYCLKPKSVAKFFDKKLFKIISATILIAFIVIVFINTDKIYGLCFLLTGRNSYEKLNDAFSYGGLIRLAYYAVTFLIGSAVVCLVPKRLGNGRVAKLGSRTLQIYSLHYFFIFLYTGLIADNFQPAHPIPWTIGLAVLITAICSLKFWEPIFYVIMNPKIIKHKSENRDLN